MIEDTKTYNGHTYSGNLLVACQNGYAQGRVDAYEDAEKRLRYLWKQYEADKENVPKPQFTEAIALITMLELDEEEKDGVDYVEIGSNYKKRIEV